MVLGAQLDVKQAHEPRSWTKVATLVLDSRMPVQLLKQEVCLRDAELEARGEWHYAQRAENGQSVRDEYV